MKLSEVKIGQKVRFITPGWDSSYMTSGATYTVARIDDVFVIVHCNDGSLSAFWPERFELVDKAGFGSWYKEHK